MQFAVLGNDRRIVPLARAALDLGHSLRWIEPTAVLQSSLPAPSAAASAGENWELLLDARQVDFVLVGRGTHEDLQAEQLRKLVQVGIPLLTVHPLSMSVLFCFELDMIRRETDSVLHHYAPPSTLPLTGRLQKRISAPDRSLGQIDVLTFERVAPSAGRTEVLEQFACDADWIAELCGQQTQVGAMAATTGNDRLGNLTVQLSGAGPVVTRWSLVESSDGAGCRLQAAGSQGRFVLTWPDKKVPELVVVQQGEEQTESVPADWNPAGEAIRRLTDAIERQTDKSTWFEASQSVELVEAVERSLAKGRTIELDFEQYGSEATFKGRMAAIGCGLLLAAMGVMLLAGFVGDTLKLSLDFLPAPWNQMGRLWPLALLAVLVVFLLLQLLPKLFPQPDSPQPDSPDENDEDPSPR